MGDVVCGGQYSVGCCVISVIQEKIINIGERAGSGVPNIFNVWADEGWEEPVIEERFDPDRTVLTLSFKQYDDKKRTKTAKQQEKILNYMEIDKGYRLQDFCKLLGLKETRIKEILKPLISQGKILVIGNNKDQRYKIG